MENTENNNTDNRLKTLKMVSSITGIATLLILLLMIINFLQLKTSDPLELKSLQALLEQYDENPQNDELKEEIRALDLLARKVYFTKEWQLETGAILLLVFAAISLLGLRQIQTIRFRLSIPDDEKKESEWGLKSQTRISVAYTGIFLAGLIFVVYFFSDREFGNYLSKNMMVLNDSTIDLPIGQHDNNETIDPSTTENEDDTSMAVEESMVENQDSMALTKDIDENQSTEMTNAAAQDPFKSNHVAFRGFRGQGISYNKNIPVEWNGPSGKNIKWQAKVPRNGFSSPIIWDNMVFLTGGDEVVREVYCFDRFSGKILWTVLVDNIPGSPDTPPKTTDDTGLAAPTMTTDGQYVFAIFGTGDIICLDMNGQRIWAKNLGIPDNHYGHSSSLISNKNLVYIQFDDKISGKLIALDTKTGNEKFKTIRKSSVAWTSPIIIQRNGKLEVVIDSDPGLAGYDATTGKEIWQIDCLNGEIGASPAYNGKYVFASNEYAKMVAVSPGQNPQLIWEGYDYLPEVSSPVATANILVSATSFGGVGCFDPNTGEELWNAELDNGFYSSPIIADGKIFLTDIKGNTYIIKESKTYELLGKQELGEDVFCTPAFADGYIYIRGTNNLYCISEEK